MQSTHTVPGMCAGWATGMMLRDGGRQWFSNRNLSSHKGYLACTLEGEDLGPLHQFD